MAGSKSRRKNNKNKKEKNDASPHKVPELIEPQSNQAFQQPEVQIGNKFDGNSERTLACNLEFNTGPEWVKHESYLRIQETDLGCNTELWSVVESGDKLYVTSPEGRLYPFDSRSSKVCSSVSTIIAPHASDQHREKRLLESFSNFCMSRKQPDVEVMYRGIGRRPRKIGIHGYVVRSTSVTKRHVIPSPLNSCSVQKLKEATTDSPSDITLCIKVFDYQATHYTSENIIVRKFRHATSIISIVSRDAVRRHEKNDVPARQGQYLLTPGRHCNLTWVGKDDKNTVVVEGHDLDADVIYIEKGQSDDDAVKKEVSIVRAACNVNLNLLKVFDVKSYQDFYEVSTKRCGMGLREFILSSRKDHKILMQLIRGIVTGLIGLHDKGIFIGNLDISNIFVDKPSNVKISVISEKTKFPLISSSKAATDDMLALGRLIFFILAAGVEYNNEDLTKPNRSNDYLNPIYDNPKALDLLRKLLDENPVLRPTALQVWNHPLLWDPSKELKFIWTVSEHLESEDRNSELSAAINSIRNIVFVTDWGTFLDVQLLNAVECGAYIKYKQEYFIMHYLIRFIRNVISHQRKIRMEINRMQNVPPEVNEMFKTGEFGSYFFSRFPKLVMEVYNIMKERCGEDIKFRDYFKAVLDN